MKKVDIQKTVTRALKLREAHKLPKLTEKQKEEIVNSMTERFARLYEGQDHTNHHLLNSAYIDELIRNMELHLQVECYTDIPHNKYYEALSFIDKFIIDQRAMEQEMGKLIQRLSRLANNILVIQKNIGMEDDYIYAAQLTTNLALWYNDLLHETHAVA